MSKYTNFSKEELLELLKKQDVELARKKYGLVWDKEKEQEKVVLDCAKNLPILKNINEKDLKNCNADYNIMIEGDNYHALQVLNYTHKGKINVIYIDPPYNTGNNDFKYNDKFIDKTDGYRHSKWLNFMEKRLDLAKELLKDDGVIFISIDDNEQANLKLLCDHIFGEGNFVNIISVNMKNIAGASGGGEDKRFKKNIEYLLIYAKNYYLIPQFKSAYEYTEIFELVEQYKENNISWKYTSVLLYEGDKEYVGSTVDGDGNDISIFKRNNPIIKSISQVANDEVISVKEVYYKYINKIFRTTMPQSSIRPRVMQKIAEIGIDNDMYSIEYIPKTGRNKGIIYEQFYKGEKFNLFAWLNDVIEEKEKVLYKKDMQGTFWNFVAGTKNLSKEGDVVFKNGKKPLELIKKIINLYPNINIEVLDFFAGSGTTAHAVLELNKEDGGNRKFIVCTNNENNIAEEVCYPRIQKVIEGYNKNGNGDFVEGLGGNLKYFKCDFVKNSRNKEQTKANLARHCSQVLGVKTGIYEPVQCNNYYNIFSNIQKNKYLCVFFDFASDNFQEFLNQVKNLNGEKYIFVFSLKEDLDLTIYKDIDNAHIEPIPQEILDTYIKITKAHIVRESKNA